MLPFLADAAGVILLAAVLVGAVFGLIALGASRIDWR